MLNPIKNQKMKLLFKRSNKSLHLCILLVCVLLICCKTAEEKEMTRHSDSCFIVEKIKRHKNGVYVIYAHRNDSVFKIISYYNGNKKGSGKKLSKGMSFIVPIESVFGDFERTYNVVPPCNVMMEFRGVAIGKEPDSGIDDVWFSKDLNGPYLPQ